MDSFFLSSLPAFIHAFASAGGGGGREGGILLAGQELDIGGLSLYSLSSSMRARYVRIYVCLDLFLFV